MAERMVIIQEFASEMDATLAQSVLEANNIPSIVIRDNAGGMLPVMHFVYPIQLAVNPGDAELAREILGGAPDDADDGDDAFEDESDFDGDVH